MGFDVVGKSVPQIDALQKAMGRTRFVSDLALPNMLHGRILRSPFPHAWIRHVDVSRAKKLAGVKGVIAFADTPGIKFGPRTEDWTILAGDKARFCGDEVAGVAAIDEDIAEEALELIRVEYEELPYVDDPIEAMKPGAPIIHSENPGNIASEFHVERGAVDAAFDEAYFVYEDRFYTNQVYQAYLEPMGAIVEKDLSGRFVFWVGTQVPSTMRMTYAKALGVSPDMLRVIVPDYGGAFGAKMENNLHLIGAVLADKTGRPVRIFNTRQDDFIAGNPRVPMYIDIKLGVTKEGLLSAKDVTVVGAAGARVVWSHAVVSTACYRVDSLYRFKSVRSRGYTVYTNTTPTSCFRGFGNSQMTFVLESALDMVADKIGMDPVELRLKNAVGPGEVSIHGWKIRGCGLRECISEATKAANWQEKKRQKRALTGIGVACCNHISSNRIFYEPFDGGAGIVRVGRDGRILVYHGESDMGQGQKTAFAQIVAERMGVSLDMVSMAQVDTDVSPFGLGSFATRGTLIGGNGVLAAAEDAFKQLARVAAGMLEANVEDIVCQKGQFFVRGASSHAIAFKKVADQASVNRRGAPVIGNGFYDPGTVLPDPETKYGNVSPAYPFGCQIAEVEVDPDTGQVRVTNFTAAHDVGRAINPMATEGQIHGGVAQGLGWALMENMVVRDGKLINPNFLDYVIPGSKDIPPITCILVEPIEPEGPYGAKGIGEPALNPSIAAITNAVYDAIGIRIKRLPISAESILAELRKRRL